jgi:hypothetical protein
MDHPWKLIIRVGAEGGALGLYRTCAEDGGFRFCATTNESTLADLLGDDQDVPVMRGRSRVVDDWPSALELLEEYPWRELFPLQVSSEFRSLVWEALMCGYPPDRNLRRWAELCGLKRAQWMAIVSASVQGDPVELQGAQTPEEDWRFALWVRGIPMPTHIVEPGWTQPGAWSEVAEDWASALRLLDQHPWAVGTPKLVHPRFAREVLDAVAQRDPRAVAAWQRVCKM